MLFVTPCTDWYLFFTRVAAERSPRARRLYRRVEPTLSDVQVLALTAAVAAMVASQADLVVARPDVLALVVGPLVELPLLSVVSRVLLAARDRGLTGPTSA